jgi:surfeit locus 1 family protein
MPNKLKFRIHNWKLAVLALALIVLFTSLGIWQLSRAHQKQQLLESFAKRALHAPFFAKNLDNVNDWRFYRVQLTGTFDNQHSFLLDNKTYHGKVGYEVYTPFQAHGMDMLILVDRGFVPLGASRGNLPKIHDIEGDVTIIGMLNLPPLYMALGRINDNAHITWPLRIEFVNIADMANLLKNRLFPYVLSMDPQDPRSYTIEWKVVIMTPEKHIGYAVQWFALALTLLILFVALNRSR